MTLYDSIHFIMTLINWKFTFVLYIKAISFLTRQYVRQLYQLPSDQYSVTQVVPVSDLYHVAN